MPAPANNNIANAQVLAAGTTQVTGDTTDATTQTGETKTTGSPWVGGSGAAHKTVWFLWVAPSAAAATITTVGSSIDTVLSIYRAIDGISDPVTDVTNLLTVAGDDDSGGGSSSSVTFTPTAGTVYYVQISGFGSGDFGPYVLNYPSPAGTFYYDDDREGAGEFLESEVSLATEFTLPAGQITRFRWPFPAVAPGVTPQIRLYAAGGSLVAGPVSFDTSTLSALNWATPGSPISVSAGTYRATVNTTRYPAKSGFFTGGPVTRGSITAVQGRFGSGVVAPTSTSTTSYLVDIDFTPGSGGPVTHNADATLTAIGTLSGTATRDTSTAAALAAAGGLTGTATRTTSTTATLAATGALTATATVDRAALATLAATGTLTAAGERTAVTTGTLSATGALTPTATAARGGTANLTAIGGLTATAAVTRATASSLTAVGGLTADATVTTPGTETGTLTATGGLTATAAHTAVNSGLLVGTGSLAGAAVRETTGTVTLPASGTLTAGATVDRVTLATFAGTAALTAVADLANEQAGNLAAVGGLTAAASVARAAGVTLAAVSALAGQSGTVQSATAVFTATGALTAATVTRRRPGRFTTGSTRSRITAGSVRADTYLTGGADG